MVCVFGDPDKQVNDQGETFLKFVGSDTRNTDNMLMEIVGAGDGGIQAVFSEEAAFRQTRGMGRQQPREKWNSAATFQSASIFS